ncbi:MAG: tetratricopeptide repeat protein [Cyanosarcina radialis HA8281-LM2]|jgi:superkiller protein 3|nr:tetratricopeptide repeat protein [Cyanosarcina radialis HA8281-LM2]
MKFSSGLSAALISVSIALVIPQAAVTRSVAEVSQVDRASTAEEYIRQGDALFQQVKIEEAIAAYKKAIQLEPDNSQAYEKLALILLSEPENIDRVIDLYQQAISLNPQDNDYHIGLLWAWLAKGNIEEATTRFQKIAGRKKPLFPPPICADPNGCEQLESEADKQPYEEWEIYDDLFTRIGFLEVHLDYQISWKTKIRFLQKLISINPERPGVYYLLGQVLVYQGKTEEAIALLEKAINLNSKNEEIYYLLGVLYNEKGRSTEAIAVLEKAVKLNFKNKDIYYLLGKLYNQQGKLSEAIAVLEKAITIDPKYVDAQAELGWILLSSNRLEEAMARFEKAEQAESYSGKLYTGKGWALVLQRKSEQAINYFGLSTMLIPMEIVPMGAKDQNWYHEFTGLSISLIDEGKLFNEFLNHKYPASIDASYKVDKKRAFDRLQKVLENSPRTSENYKRLAIVLLAQSQPEAGFSSLEKAIAINPNDLEAYQLLGWWMTANLLKTEGKPVNPELREKVVAHWQSVMKKFPQDIAAYQGLSTLLIEEQKWTEAIATLERAIALNPKDPNIYLSLAIALSGRGQDREAKEAFQKTLMLESNKVYAYLYFSEALYKQGKNSEVARIFQQAVNIELEAGKRILKQSVRSASVFGGIGFRPSYLPTLYANASQNLEEGNLETAIATFRKILVFEPKAVAAYDGLCEALYRQDKFTEALETCQKASTVNLASQSSFAPKEQSLEYWVRQFNIAKVKRRLAYQQNPSIFNLPERLPTVQDDPLVSLKRSVIRILSQEMPRGTGWVFKREGSKAWILTNRHVVTEPDLQTRQKNLEIELYSQPPDGQFRQRLSAKIVNVTPKDDPLDLAILEVTGLPADIQPLQLATGKTSLEQPVRAIGHPVDRPEWAVMEGKVWQKREKFIVLSAQVALGASGSPVLDMDNHVVGILYEVRFGRFGFDKYNGAAFPIGLVRERLQKTAW